MTYPSCRFQHNFLVVIALPGLKGIKHRYIVRQYLGYRFAQHLLRPVVQYFFSGRVEYAYPAPGVHRHNPLVHRVHDSLYLAFFFLVGHKLYRALVLYSPER